MLKRRRNRRGVNPLCLTGETGAIGIRNRRWKFGERLQQGARHRIGGNQIGDLLRQIAQRDFGRCVAALQTFLHQLRLLIDVSGKSFHALQNNFVFGDIVVRRIFQRIGGSLLHAFHLIYRHPQASWHDESKRKRVIAVSQSFVRRLEQLRIQIEIELFILGQRVAPNLLQLRDGLREVLVAALNARRRIIGPTRVLAGKAESGRDFRVLLLPALPVGLEIGAEFAGFVVRRGEGEERGEEGEEGEEDYESHFWDEPPGKKCSRRGVVGSESKIRQSARRGDRAEMGRSVLRPYISAIGSDRSRQIEKTPAGCRRYRSECGDRRAKRSGGRRRRCVRVRERA